MKSEIKFKWEINLLDSNLCKGRNSKVGCIRDFEVIAKAPESSSEFRDWFERGFNNGIFELVENKNNKSGRPTRFYKINESKLIKILFENELFAPAKRVIDRVTCRVI